MQLGVRDAPRRSTGELKNEKAYGSVEGAWLSSVLPLTMLAAARGGRHGVSSRCGNCRAGLSCGFTLPQIAKPGWKLPDCSLALVVFRGQASGEADQAKKQISKDLQRADVHDDGAV